MPCQMTVELQILRWYSKFAAAKLKNTSSNQNPILRPDAAARKKPTPAAKSPATITSWRRAALWRCLILTNRHLPGSSTGNVRSLPVLLTTAGFHSDWPLGLVRLRLFEVAVVPGRACNALIQLSRARGCSLATAGLLVAPEAVVVDAEGEVGGVAVVEIGRLVYDAGRISAASEQEWHNCFRQSATCRTNMSEAAAAMSTWLLQTLGSTRRDSSGCTLCCMTCLLHFVSQAATSSA